MLLTDQLMRRCLRSRNPELPTRVRAQVGAHDETSALGREGERDGAAEAGGGAGHDGNAVGETGAGGEGSHCGLNRGGQLVILVGRVLKVRRVEDGKDG